MWGLRVMAESSSSPGNELREKVREAYSNAAGNVAESHPFPLGFDFAQSLGYPDDLLHSLPQSSVARFTGVSNVSMFSYILTGSTVLDLGCRGEIQLVLADSLGL